jgi:uncharacterized membrane protein
VKLSFLVIVGMILVIIGFIGFFVPLTDSGLTVLEADKLCQKSPNSSSLQETEKPKVCEYTKFFNSIYFLFGIGLVLIFWSGYMEKYHKRKKS